MNTVSRGIRNAFRNSIRTFSIVAILGLSIGLTLAMLVARASVEDKIKTVKSSVGNTVTISPAGAQGFQGGGEPLKTDTLAKITTLPHVTGVTESLSDRLTTETTNLVSAIDAGSLGRRGSGNNGVGFQGPPDGARPDGAGAVTRTFTPPLIVTASSNTTSASAYGGDTVTFTSGQALDPAKDENVAVVGTSLAAKNNLAVGSTFSAYGQTITVAGIYDTGNTFANAGMMMQLAALQRLSSQPGDVTNAVATIDSVDNLDSTIASIKNTLGETVDVVSNQESAKSAVQPLESVKSISTFSLIGALIAGAVIILLTMVMIVRERRREIGVFKAIGASNLKIMLQFMSEAVTLTVLALGAGLLIGVAAANPITKTLVSNSVSATQSPAQGGQGRIRVGGPGLRGVGNNALASVRNVKASVGSDIIGYGVLSAFLIAILGSAIPSLLISKIRPADVMRAE